MLLKGDINTNLALKRPAYQSSTKSTMRASRAVDERWNAESSTDYGDFRPWWKVQLAYPVWVLRVRLNVVVSKYILFKCVDTILDCYS